MYYVRRENCHTPVKFHSFVKKEKEEIKLMRKYQMKINMVYMLLNRAGRLKVWKRGAVFN